MLHQHRQFQLQMLNQPFVTVQEGENHVLGHHPHRLRLRHMFLMRLGRYRMAKGLEVPDLQGIDPEVSGLYLLLHRHHLP